MTDFQKLSAVYHPAVTIKNKTTLATLCLYFDEVHCVPFFPLYESEKGDLRDFQIIVPFAVEGDEMTSFLLDNGPLENEVLFYQRESIGKMLRAETVESEQLVDLAEAVFRQERLDMHSIVRFSVIQMLTEKRGWVPVGDEPDIPVPLPQERDFLSTALPTSVAEESFRCVLPVCQPVSPENILEARESLKEELLPFRMAMQRLYSVLRNETLPDDLSLVEVKQEAKSMADKAVEPALNDLRKKIELAQGKVWKHTFGSVVGWAPLVGFAFAAPAPDLICRAFEKASEDTDDLLLAEERTGASTRPNLSLLLHVDEIRKEIAGNP
jgi:hypothetical protein